MGVQRSVKIKLLHTYRFFAKFHFCSCFCFFAWQDLSHKINLNLFIVQRFLLVLKLHLFKGVDLIKARPFVDCGHNQCGDPLSIKGCELSMCVTCNVFQLELWEWFGSHNVIEICFRSSCKRRWDRERWFPDHFRFLSLFLYIILELQSHAISRYDQEKV